MQNVYIYLTLITKSFPREHAPLPLIYFCGEVVTAHAVALTSLHYNCCVFKCACLTPIVPATYMFPFVFSLASVVRRTGVTSGTWKLSASSLEEE